MGRVSDLIYQYYSQVPIGQRSLERAIQEVLSQQSPILDAGCGIDAPLTRKFGAQIETVGIDLCKGLPADLPVVSGDLGHLPFRDGAFTVVFSRSVFEHLANPKQVLQEFHRVLKPNGFCVILTPNRFDYSSIIAALTPHRFHRWFVKTVFNSQSYDTFPTIYRANTPAFFRALASKGKGWEVRRISGVRHYPANLAFSRLLFRLGIAYDWLIARAGLTALQPSLLVVLRRT